MANVTEVDREAARAFLRATAGHDLVLSLAQAFADHAAAAVAAERDRIDSILENAWNTEHGDDCPGLILAHKLIFTEPQK